MTMTDFAFDVVLFECASLEDALAWAARIPDAATGAVEVRPVHVEPEA